MFDDTDGAVHDALIWAFERNGLGDGARTVLAAARKFSERSLPLRFGRHGTYVGVPAPPSGAGLFFLESILFAQVLKTLEPITTFIVGNGFGWSTVLAGLSVPNQRVLCIEKDPEWIWLANEIAEANNPNTKVVLGVSPSGVAGILSGETVGVCLIDGEHTNAAAANDYNAVKEFSRDDTLFLFHDVGILPVRQAWDESVGPEKRLLKMESGMGISTSRKTWEKIEGVFEPFVQ